VVQNWKLFALRSASTASIGNGAKIMRLLGSWMGALHLDPRTLRLLLAFLLLAAAARMIAASF